MVTLRLLVLTFIASFGTARPAVGSADARRQIRAGGVLRLSGGASEWSAHLTEDGRTYYFNDVTGMSSWEPSAEGLVQETTSGEWTQHTTDAG